MVMVKCLLHTNAKREHFSIRVVGPWRACFAVFGIAVNDGKMTNMGHYNKKIHKHTSCVF